MDRKRSWVEEEFDPYQEEEIKAGIEAGVDIAVYARRDLFALQMREIRLGLMDGLPMAPYADNSYDWFQLVEIRKGLRQGLDVSAYADPSIPYDKMKQLRKGLKEGLQLKPYLAFPAKLMRELRKAFISGVNIIEYAKAGYDDEQLEQIRMALEKGIEIGPYLVRELRGVSISEICLGLEERLDVSLYAKTEYSWQQMREIRLGLESRVDVSLYSNKFYSWQQMQEIRLGLEQGLDVSRYRSLMYTAEEMKRRRLALESERDMEQGMGEGALNVLEEALDVLDQQLPFRIAVSRDEMEAVVLLDYRGQKVAKKALKKILREQGVLQGIDEKTLDRLEKGELQSRTVRVAQGKPAGEGENGWYEYFFRTELNHSPRLLEDGSLDYQNIDWFETVEKDQKLACYHPAGEGEAGYTVTGKALPGKQGQEQNLLTGKGFKIDEDGCTYRAETDGRIELEGARLEVSGLLIVDRVTSASGGIRYDGSVYVRGNVGSGASIQAAGDVIIDGFVEAAAITCGGSVILKQGANGGGGKGCIRAGHSVEGRFFESVNVFAGEDIKTNFSLSSSLHAEGRIIIDSAGGSLAGGTAYAAGGFLCCNVGNRSEILTIVKLGLDEVYLKKKLELEEKITEIEQSLDILRGSFADYQRKYSPEACADMDIYQKIENSIYTLEEKRGELCRKVMGLEEAGETIRRSEAVIRGRLFKRVVFYVNGLTWHSKEVGNVTVKSIGSRVAVYANEGRQWL